MGVGINDVTPENAKFFDMKDANGAVVSEVTPGAPGAKAGLQPGDVITAINGQKVSDAGELQMKVQQQKPGSTINLAVMRDGKSLNVPVTVEKMGGKNNTELANAEGGKPRWGVGISDLNDDVRQQIQAPSQVKGAVVQRVVPGSPADDAGLRPGDVIESVNRKDTPNAADVQQALSNVPKGESALVRVWSNGGSTFRVLHPSQG